MSTNPHWRKVCVECGSVCGAYAVTDGDDGKAVEFLSESKNSRDLTRLERLMPGDEGHPVKIDPLCVHLGGSYLPPDPNQGELFGATA